MISAPTAPLPSSTGIPRGLVIAGSIVLTLVLGFLGLGRYSFLAPPVTTPPTLDGMSRDETLEGFMKTVADQEMGDLSEDRFAIGAYSSPERDRTLIAIPFRDSVTIWEMEQLLAAEGKTQRVGDGICVRTDVETLKCASTGFYSAALVVEVADPALGSSPQHIVDIAEAVRP